MRWESLRSQYRDQGKFFLKYGLIALDLDVALYFLAVGLEDLSKEGFGGLTCPVCVSGFLYTARPASLIIFSGFLILMVFATNPRRAIPATIFAAGTFDWITSWSYHLFPGTQWYLEGTSNQDLMKFVVMISVPLILIQPNVNRKAIAGLGIAWGIGLAITEIGYVNNLQLIPWSIVNETVLEVAYCMVAYLFFVLPKAKPDEKQAAEDEKPVLK